VMPGHAPERLLEDQEHQVEVTPRESQSDRQPEDTGCGERRPARRGPGTALGRGGFHPGGDSSSSRPIPVRDRTGVPGGPRQWATRGSAGGGRRRGAPRASATATRSVTRSVASRRMTTEPPTGSHALDRGNRNPLSRWKTTEATRAPAAAERAAAGA